MADLGNYSFSVWQPRLQQPATGLACRTDAISLDKQAAHKPLVTAGPNSVKMKRGHVSKACTNCRKMHAGCDIQRPCSRCVFHRMESSCVDIPRKKRITRGEKKQGEDSPDDSPPEVTTAILIDGKDDQFEAPNEKVWKDTFTELFGEVRASVTPSSSLPATPATPATPGASNFFQPPLLFGDLLANDTDPNKSFQTNDFLNSDSSLYESPKKDFQEMKIQMEDLRRSNVMLEDRLDHVTQELTEMRQKMQQMLQLLGGFFVQSPQGSSKNNEL